VANGQASGRRAAKDGGAVSNLLADELTKLVVTWRASRWLAKVSVAHVIAVKVAYRLPEIVKALNDAERHKVFNHHNGE
jgi:hypothetical protein